MRILLVHNEYSQRGGEDVVVDQEIELLRDAGHEVTRYSRSSDEIGGFSTLSKAALPARITWSPSDARAVSRLLAAERYDVVHVHNSFPLISASVLQSCRRAGVPVVTTLHNFRLLCAAGILIRDGVDCRDCLGRLPLPAVRHRCYRNSVGATVPLASSIAVHSSLKTWPRLVDRALVMSEFAASIFAGQGWPREKIVMKPHFVRPVTPPREGPGGYALFVGRLARQKGPDQLLKAWRREFGELRIVGAGEQQAELEALATPFGDAIRFEGVLPREEALRMMAGARVVVSPSRAQETFGLTSIEAFAHGVPAIAPDHGACPEIVDDTVGALFAPGDVTALSEALARLLDPSESSRCGANAFARYEERYSPEANLHQLESIYQDAIDHRAVR